MISKPIALPLDTLQSEKGSLTSTPSTRLSTPPSPTNRDIQLLIDRTRELNYNVPDAVISTTKGSSERPNPNRRDLSFATFGDVIVQDGDMAAQLRTKYFHNPDSNPSQDLKGQVSKTRLFGQSHWMHACSEVLTP